MGPTRWRQVLQKTSVNPSVIRRPCVSTLSSLLLSRVGATKDQTRSAVGMDCQITSGNNCSIDTGDQYKQKTGHLVLE